MGAPLIGRRARSLALLGAGLGVAAVLLVWWKAEKAIDRGKVEVRAEGVIEATFAAVPAARAVGVTLAAGPAGFRDMVFDGGRVLIASAGGLRVIDGAGLETAFYRSGFELPPVELTAIAKAPGDEVWMGTASEGALVFSGGAFKQLRPSLEKYRNVTAVLALDSGPVLLGTASGGVLSWDGSKLGLHHAALADLQVTALAGTDADLWVGTRDKGVVRLRAGQVETYREGLPDARVLSLAVDGEKCLAGTAMGVAVLAQGRVERVIAPGFFANAVAARGAETIVGTLSEGVVVAPGSKSVDEGVRIVRLVREGDSTYALAPDAVFEVGRAGQLKKVMGSAKATLTDGNVSALAFDGAGRLWVGYFDRGLDIASADLSKVEHHESDRLFCVNRVVPNAAQGRTAVATANGLVMFDSSGKQRQVLTKRDGLIADHVTDVAWMGDGMAVGTPAGVTFVDAGGPRSLYAFHGLVNNHVYALGVAGKRLLAGTLGGLSVVDGEVVKAGFTTFNSGLKHNWITALAQDGSDGWLVGTYGAGVMLWRDGGTWEAFPELPKGLVINPNALVVTEGGALAGTLGGGLAVLNKARGNWFMVRGELPSLNVTAVAVSGDVAAIGTDNGLVKMPMAGLGIR